MPPGSDEEGTVTISPRRAGTGDLPGLRQSEPEHETGRVDIRPQDLGSCVSSLSTNR